MKISGTYFNKPIYFKSKNLLNMPQQELLSEVKASIKPENFIGQGTEAEVYRIQDTDYCVRIPYEALEINQFRFSKDITPIDKINHVIARLGYGASIIKYFEGITPKRYMSNNHDRYLFQEQIANMPVKSYSELLHQITKAIDNGLLFDFSPGNLIVDTKNQKLTAIDFIGISDNPRKIRPLCEMYSVLTSYGSLEKTGKKIFDKIVDAGLEEFKPEVIPCMDIKLFDFIELVLKRNSDNNYSRIGNITERINEFNSLKYSISDSFKTLKELKNKELVDKTLSPILTDKISEFKNLITKVH